MDSLTHLVLAQCSGVTDDGVAALAPLTRLRHLDLSCCDRVTGGGFERFCTRTPLASLVLSNCTALDDDGLHALGRLTCLVRLDLSHCRGVSDAGIAGLHRLRLLTGETRTPPRRRLRRPHAETRARAAATDDCARNGALRRDPDRRAETHVTSPPNSAAL